MSAGALMCIKPPQAQELIMQHRRILQANTCCANHASDIALKVMATFALDIVNHNPQAAAAIVEIAVREVARQIRSGELRMQPVKR